MKKSKAENGREKLKDSSLLALMLKDEAKKRQPLEIRKEKKTDSPLESSKRNQPSDTLILVQ